MRALDLAAIDKLLDTFWFYTPSSYDEPYYDGLYEKDFNETIGNLWGVEAIDLVNEPNKVRIVDKSKFDDWVGFFCTNLRAKLELVHS